MAKFTTRKIGKPKKTLSAIFQSARKKADLTLEQLEYKTKIRLKYLKALEEGDYRSLPAEAYNIGFVRVCAKFLNLEEEKVVELYKQERSNSRLASASNKIFTPTKTRDWGFLVTPKFIGIIIGVAFFGSLITYVGAQINKFNQPPQIVLTNMADQYMTKEDRVTLAGKTDPGAMISVNDETVNTTKDGDFTQEVSLNLGVNEVTVLATNRAEKQSRKVVKILYNPSDVARAN